MQGRFTLEANVDKSFGDWNNPLMVLSGGFWVNINHIAFMGKWKGEVTVFLKFKNDQNMHHLHVINEMDAARTLSSAPSGALFGDHPDSTQDLTWLPIFKAYLRPGNHLIHNLLTGKADFVLATGSWIPIGYDKLSWETLSEHTLSFSQRSNDQLVIKGSINIPQIIIRELQSFGHVWIGQKIVTKSEFDAFGTSLFSQHGNDTPQAKRASVLAWVSRPSFVNEPEWQAFLCLAILANVGYPYDSRMHHHDSGLVLESRTRIRLDNRNVLTSDRVPYWWR